MVDCSPKMRVYNNLSEAMTSCSRDIDCKGVVQSCALKENQTFSTCREQQQLSDHYQTALYPYLKETIKFDSCGNLAYYQKSIQ